jgi:type IV pilus assembly protein PilO
MNLSDINELNLSNIGSWPLVVRAAAIAAVGVSVFVLGYIFHIKGQFGRLEKAQGQEVTLKQKFEGLQKRLYNLDDYEAYLEEMEGRFGVLLRQLPSKAEVADLVEDISRTGLGNQLIFDSFDPGEEKKREFYAELPIRVNVSGTYHQLGQFVNGVATLPRIVTLHDLSLSPAAEGSEQLSMEATARIYWYLEPGGKGKEGKR